MSKQSLNSTTGRLRTRAIALLPYWKFWEASVGPHLRAEKERQFDRVAKALRNVDFTRMILADGTEACKTQLVSVKCDVLLVVQSMASPPAATAELLEILPEVPVVIWALNRRAHLSDSFNHSDITREGATVGTSQLKNDLQRRGRANLLIVGDIDDPATIQRVEMALCAATVAYRLKNARLGRVGQVLPGYTCVDVADSELKQALGITVVPITTGQVREYYSSVTAEAVEHVREEVESMFRVAPELDGTPGLDRSIRFAAALEALDRDLGLDAGAMNCHVPEIRFADDPGIAPCFALGRETSRGTPWSCTGDVVTPIAMLVTKGLAGCAIYHEIEALDYGTNEALLANSGEHDLAWRRSSEKPLLHQNPWFTADKICGACACFAPPPGKASLLAFTPHRAEPSGFRFVVAEGEVSNRAFPLTGTVNGAFRFGRTAEAVDVAWARWAEAGVNHHSSATLGHIGKQVADVSHLLGIGVVQVS